MTSRVVHEISGDDGPEDEEEALPDYDEATLLAPRVPGYDGDSGDNITYTGRCVRYRLWQCDRKAQVLEVLDQDDPPDDGDDDDAPACPTYRITTKSGGFRALLSKRKPDLEVQQMLPGSRVVCMADIWFDNNNGFPWRPCAHFDYTGDDGLSSQYQMEAERFADWRVSMGGGRTLVWRLQRWPIVVLVLGERDSSGDDRGIARFTFSSLGLRARKGEEVGLLEIYDDGLTGLGREGRDRVVCSVVVVITFFGRTGKYYNNPRGG